MDPATPEGDATRLPPRALRKGVARKLVKRSIRECSKQGIDPRKTGVFTDILCTPRFYTKRIKTLQYLTRSRGQDGG